MNIGVDDIYLISVFSYVAVWFGW